MKEGIDEMYKERKEQLKKGTGRQKKNDGRIIC